MPDQRRPDETSPIADAASLFDTDEVRPLRHQGPGPSGSAPAEDAGGGGYDLEIDPFAEIPPPPDAPPLPMTGQKSRPKAAAPLPFVPGEDDEPEPPPPPRAPASRKSSRPAAPDLDTPTGDTSEFEAEFATVDPVWSRWLEWGPDLARVGLVLAGTLVLAYLVSGSIELALLVVALGGAAAVLLSYPILITMERPVRITPEHAVTDFFDAASHHFPHYRRMWLLLSSLGRESGPFPEFEDFRGHWKERVDRWRSEAGLGKTAPLKFQVAEFRAEKSTGKETSKAEYAVHVLDRSDPDGTPIASFRMSHGLVRGPDRMWYLNRGALPWGAK